MLDKLPKKHSDSELPPIEQYGVREQAGIANDIDLAVERLRRLGFAVVESGLTPSELCALSEKFDHVRKKAHESLGGTDELAKVDEHNTVRLPLAFDRAFLDLALNSNIVGICKRMIGEGILLNQQNGVINPAGRTYNQARWHRDLPYQHFVSSRPLAINALFCLDEFTLDNGATLVFPCSHLQPDFPSDELMRSETVQLTAKAGCFLVLDCMLYHSGGINRTSRERRAVNHVYTTPIIRQQIELSTCLGPDYTSDPETRRILGYGYETPRSVAEYIETRRAKS